MPSRFGHKRLAYNHFEQVTCTTGMAIAAKAYCLTYQIGGILPAVNVERRIDTRLTNEFQEPVAFPIDFGPPHIRDNCIV